MPFDDKPWLKCYDLGVPHSLKPYPEVPLHQLLRDTAKRNPDSIATLTSAKVPVVGRLKAELTFADLEAQSDALSAALVEMGLKKGDRVAIIMPNCAQFVISFYAILKAGGIVCAMNPTYPAAKMQQQLKDCGANIAITLTLFYNMLKQIQAQTDIKQMIVTNIKDYLPPLAAFLFTLAKEKKDGHRVQRQADDPDFLTLIWKYMGSKAEVDVKGSDVALFQYTGGTTGVSKAAMATHQGMGANLLQCKAWLGNAGTDRKDQRDVLLAAIPLFHVYGLVAVMSYAVSTASSMVLVPNPRDTLEVLEVIDAYLPTLFHGVPALYNSINNHPDVLAGKYNLRSIRACISGSAPLPPVTKRKFEELTGAKLVEGFGMSEAPTATHVNPLNGENRTGSIGLPLPDMEMRIVSLEDGVTDLGVDEVGELVMYGPQIMTGYYNLPTETTNVLRDGPDGKKWLYTGDIARMDKDGYFYIVDRKKDMALIGGFNVYPANVEKIIAEHPAVQEVGVASVPHPNPEKGGQEALKAWIVLKQGQQLSEEELGKFLLDRLARYEIPTRVEFVPELIKSTVGKVLRRELVQMEMAARERQKPKPAVESSPVPPTAEGDRPPDWPTKK